MLRNGKIFVSNLTLLKFSWTSKQSVSEANLKARWDFSGQCWYRWVFQKEVTLTMTSLNNNSNVKYHMKVVMADFCPWGKMEDKKRWCEVTFRGL